MAIQVGDKAPSFSLFNTEKQEVSLSQFQGKTLIVHFFPLAFTGVCTKQLCTLRDGIQMYRNDSCDVVAISVDSPFTLGKFKAEQNLPFDLLSDFNREVSAAYGAQHEVFPALGLKGVAKRSAFVIDGQGIIRYAEVLESPGDLPNFEAINSVVASL